MGCCVDTVLCVRQDVWAQCCHTFQFLEEGSFDFYVTSLDFKIWQPSKNVFKYYACQTGQIFQTISYLQRLV